MHLDAALLMVVLVPRGELGHFCLGGPFGDGTERRGLGGSKIMVAVCPV